MEVHYIEWHITPFRRDRFLEIWRPALDRALAYGAKSRLPHPQRGRHRCTSAR